MNKEKENITETLNEVQRLIDLADKENSYNDTYFNGSFYNWLLKNGIELAMFESEMLSSAVRTEPYIAKVNMGQLRVAILMLIENSKNSERT